MLSLLNVEIDVLISQDILTWLSYYTKSLPSFLSIVQFALNILLCNLNQLKGNTVWTQRSVAICNMYKMFSTRKGRATDRGRVRENQSPEFDVN